jgi:hypothetical protein
MENQTPESLRERISRSIGPISRVVVVLLAFVGVPFLVMQGAASLMDGSAITPELTTWVRWALIGVFAISAFGAFQVLNGLRNEP